MGLIGAVIISGSLLYAVVITGGGGVKGRWVDRWFCATNSRRAWIELCGGGDWVDMPLLIDTKVWVPEDGDNATWVLEGGVVETFVVVSISVTSELGGVLGCWVLGMTDAMVRNEKHV